MAKKKDFEGVVEESFQEGYASEAVPADGSYRPVMGRKEFSWLVVLAERTNDREEFIRLSGHQHAAHIWDVAHCSIRDIRLHSGLTQAEFAEYYLMSKRAVESWEGGQRNAPLYLKVLLADATGYLRITVI